MRILGISGSLRDGSYNTGLLRAAQDLAPDGVDVELYDGLAEIPPYDQDVQAAETAARVLEGEVAVPHAHERFDENGRLADEMARGRLAGILERLAEEASLLQA